jgi:hypothetical protein
MENKDSHDNPDVSDTPERFPSLDQVEFLPLELLSPSMAALFDDFESAFKTKKTEEAIEGYLQHFQDALQKTESEEDSSQD